jgi:predicted nucleic acid-binding protein
LKYVLDADVLVGALDSSDAHHVRSRELFAEWREHQDNLIVSVVNLSEVLIAPAADQKSLRAARKAITALGVSAHPANEAIAVDASRLRSRHPISLPDGYLLATARHTNATAVSYDRKITQAATAEHISLRLDDPAG